MNESDEQEQHELDIPAEKIAFLKRILRAEFIAEAEGTIQTVPLPDELKGPHIIEGADDDEGTDV